MEVIQVMLQKLYLIVTPGQLSRKSRHLVTAVTPAVLPKKMAARRQHFSSKEVIEQKAAVVAAAVKLRLHKFVVVHIRKNDSYVALASWTNLQFCCLRISIYALTILYYNYNWSRQMTRGWVLLLLNIRLHVKGFNKLIYIGTFKYRYSTSLFLGFSNYKDQALCIKIEFSIQSSTF